MTLGSRPQLLGIFLWAGAGQSCSCRCSVKNEGMSLTNHSLWLPTRGLEHQQVFQWKPRPQVSRVLPLSAPRGFNQGSCMRPGNLAPHATGVCPKACKAPNATGPGSHSMLRSREHENLTNRITEHHQLANSTHPHPSASRATVGQEPHQELLRLPPRAALLTCLAGACHGTLGSWPCDLGPKRSSERLGQISPGKLFLVGVSTRNQNENRCAILGVSRF